ncbi:MAG: hypothetical protein JSV98_01690 [candidate division WOR-3 bacterium]|nr:MAG: hypothetical protein JSV98_01690 [candidate division WOR-3 bacterium]
MAIIIAFLVNASIFSIGGIGEDLGVFHHPFMARGNLARLSFKIDPEYMLLQESGDLRGVFWTNPVKLSLGVPLGYGFGFMVGNRERFNQCFDVYLEDSSLQIHALGEGGVEEVYAGLSKRLGAFEIATTGSFLFGNAWEIWTHSIASYSLVDTFSYRSRGRIFAFGFRHDMFSIAYESFGRVRMIHMPAETTMIDLPERLSVGVFPRVAEYSLGVVYEHSFWSDTTFDSPNRFKVSISRRNLGLTYYYNPWYFNDVSEHGLAFEFGVPLRNIGSVSILMDLSLRSRDGLRELMIKPKLNFVLNELFALRRK